jgi:hypothetical protein
MNLITNLQPYPGYEESNQAWLGRVPKHWPVLPNRVLFAEVKERNHPDTSSSHSSGARRRFSIPSSW